MGIAKFRFKRWREDSFFSGNGSFLKFDKLEHLILGFLGMLFTLVLAKVTTAQEFVLFWIVWNAIGLGWEYMQFITRHYLPEPKDIVANNAGFVLAAMGFYGWLLIG